MKPIHQRIIAILLLATPGVIGIYGWTVIRDVVFNTFAGQSFDWLAFLGGSACLVFALFIIGGFIFHRDRKNKRIDPRLTNRNKKKEDSIES